MSKITLLVLERGHHLPWTVGILPQSAHASNDPLRALACIRFVHDFVLPRVIHAEMVLAHLRDMGVLAWSLRGLVEANAVNPILFAQSLPQGIVALVRPTAKKVGVELDVLLSTRLEVIRLG